MTSFYHGRPSRSFWRGAVSDARGGEVADLYRPKVRIDPHTRIATAGSCFAQHVGQAFRGRRHALLDMEPPPAPLPPEEARRFGYGIFSARYGNIYTVRQLMQLVTEAQGRSAPAGAIWERDGRFFDALRPSVEPDGLASAALVRLHRAHHLARVAALFRATDVLVFTLGLTETWEHRASGTVYPVAPGVIAGAYDPDLFACRILTVGEVHRDFVRARAALHRFNPAMRFILSVSPVPLAATAGDAHVLVATTQAKAVLRAVAGQLATEFDDVDYFPSFELITGAAARGRFWEADLRTVSAEGVRLVMAAFFRAQGAGAPATDMAAAPAQAAVEPAEAVEIVCEEALLDAFRA